MRLSSFLFCLLALAPFLNEPETLGQSADHQVSSEKPNLQNPLARLLIAEKKDQEAIIDQLVSQNNDVRHWVALSQKQVPIAPSDARKKKLTAGWSQWEATDSEGIKRPYQVFLPENVAQGEKPAAVICHIHGAVGRPFFGEGLGSPAACGYAPFIWPKVAEKENFVIVCPQGKATCSWWTDAGVRHVRATIRDLQRSIDFPADSIYCAGFSDGGSGCYYMAMTGPDPFAGFIALNGNPIVAAQASGKQVYLHNMATVPFFAGMTHKDSLYPSAIILPHLTKAIELGADATLVAYPKMNHQPSYFGVQTDAIVDFIKKNNRPSDRRKIHWVTADKRIASTDWLEILEFGSVKKSSRPLPEGNVMSSPFRIKSGIRFGRGEKEGKIKSISKGSIADLAGLKVGDSLVSISSFEAKTTRSLRAAMSRLEYGQKYPCTVTRDGEQLHLVFEIKPFVPQQIYDRSMPTSYSTVTITPDEVATPTAVIKSRGVEKIRIWLPVSKSQKDKIEVKISNKPYDVTKTVSIKKLSAKQFLKKYAESGRTTQPRFAFVDVTHE